MMASRIKIAKHAHKSHIRACDTGLPGISTESDSRILVPLSQLDMRSIVVFEWMISISAFSLTVKYITFPVPLAIFQHFSPHYVLKV